LCLLWTVPSSSSGGGRGGGGRMASIFQGGFGYWLGVGSMCTVSLNCPLTIATVDQYTAILTQHVYVSGNLRYRSTCELSVYSFRHSMRLCVRQSQTSLNPLGLNMQPSSLKASIYVFGTIQHHSTRGVSVCSYPHAARLCVWQTQKPIHL
jgi:hypothetical protein